MVKVLYISYCLWSSTVHNTVVCTTPALCYAIESGKCVNKLTLLCLVSDWRLAVNSAIHISVRPPLWVMVYLRRK